MERKSSVRLQCRFCNRSYKSRNGLRNHYKKCNQSVNVIYTHDVSNGTVSSVVCPRVATVDASAGEVTMSVSAPIPDFTEDISRGAMSSIEAMHNAIIDEWLNRENLREWEADLSAEHSTPFSAAASAKENWVELLDLPSNDAHAPDPEDDEIMVGDPTSYEYGLMPIDDEGSLRCMLIGVFVLFAMNLALFLQMIMDPFMYP